MSRVYETAIRIAASIPKAFSRDTYDASKAITKLAESTKKLKAAEKAAAAFKKLDGEVTRSKARYDVASAALRKLEAAELAAGGATRESTKWRKAGEREIASAARQLDRASKSARKNSEALQKLGVDTSRLTGEQERLTRALAATERQEKALQHYEKSRERLFGARSKTPLVQKAGGQIRGIASDATFLASAAAGATAAIAGLVLHTIKVGDEIGDTADKLGIAGQALQEMRYGARQDGAEIESLDKALAKMAITIGKHKQLKGKGGASPLAIPGAQVFDTAAAAAAGVVDPFKQIGLKAKDLSKLKPEVQFKKISDGLLKLKTHADQAAVAQEIFGKGATEVLPYLLEGSKGIEQLAKNAHKYGGVLTDEQLKAADAADKAMKDAELAVGGLTTTLAGDLLPVATEVFKTFSGWVASNRGQIKQWSQDAAKWITDKGIPAFKHLAVDVFSVIKRVTELVQGAAKLTGGFGNLATIVVGLRLAPLALTFAKIGVEATKAAIAIFKYVAAKRAAKVAGADLGGAGAGGAGAGAGGGGAGAGGASGWILRGLGLSVGEFALLAAPVAISAAALIYAQAQKDKAVDALVSGTDEYNSKIENDPEFRQNERDKFYAKAKGITRTRGGMSTGDDVAGAVLPSAVPRTNRGGRGAVEHHSNVFHIGGVKSRDDLAGKMDDAKRQALDAYDKREAQRKRVSFGE